VPLHERAIWLRGSLESLMGQTHRNAAFVLVDDCSADNTYEIAAEYAAADARIRLDRNPHRLGLVGTWRRAYDLARETHPGARYFAWGSDHDLWDREWLGALVDALDAAPEAVLAYPQSVRLVESGRPPKRARAFETAGVRSPFARLSRCGARMSAGNMVYGLYRVAALERVGPFPAVIGPDRLFLAELALIGEFRQVPRVLWQRRFTPRVNPRRQRASFFPGGNAPFHAYVPWFLVHGGILVSRYVIRGEGLPEVGRATALAAVIVYSARSALGRLRRRLEAPYRAARRWYSRRVPAHANGSAE
jgi:glycosyltransferase involved in cell wall biosynthesis